MIISELLGGLGNQMFQYAMGKSLAKHLNTDLKFDLNALLDKTPRENFVVRDFALDVFKLTIERSSQKEIDSFFYQPPNKIVRLLRNKVFGRGRKYKYLYEPQAIYFPDVYNAPENCYLAGYWQSPKYFANIEAELRRDFTFREEILPVSHLLLQHILQDNSVCINARRFDEFERNFHGVCDMKYFMAAIDVMAAKVKDPHFYLFSDDISWCKENFKIDKYPFTIVGHEHKGTKFSNYLHLMSLCKHFIIPNSTFAWWATWLNNNADKIVIAPLTWHADKSWDPADLILPEWIRVKNN